MVAESGTPADSVELRIARKPVPRKVPTGDPKEPFRYEKAGAPADGLCGIGISFFMADNGWPQVKEVGDLGSARESGQVRIYKVQYSGSPG